MTGWRWPGLGLGLLLTMATMTAPAMAADLVIQKSLSVVTDPLGGLRPRIFTGSTIDYALIVTNPLANVLVPVRRIEIVDMIDPKLKLRVLAYPGAAGPVEFADGGLPALGLLSANVTYGYSGLASMTDGLEFFDGTNWNYVPVADADGCDPNVRGVRVKVSGAQTAGGSFRLRYRVQMR